MSHDDAMYDRLQYDLMQEALKFDVHPAAPEMEQACREVWTRVVANRPGGPIMPFADFRELFESTFRRYPELRSRPRPTRSAA